MSEHNPRPVQTAAGVAGADVPRNSPRRGIGSQSLPVDTPFSRLRDATQRPAESANSSLITVETLAAALRQSSLSSGSGTSEIAKGKLPEWSNRDNFASFEQKTILWARQHRIMHLLESPPSADELDQHDRARTVILTAIPSADRTAVFHMQHVCDAWRYIKNKYRPSVEAEVHSLYVRFMNLTLGNRRVSDYTGDVLSIASQLEALGSPVGDQWVTLRLLDVSTMTEGFDHMLPSLRGKGPLEVNSALCQHALHLEGKFGRRSQNPAGSRNQQQRGRGNGNNRGSGGGQAAAPQVAAVAGGAQREENRSCHHCGKKGHLRFDCPDLKPAVREYLKEQRQKRLDRRQQADGSRNPDVCAISTIVSAPPGTSASNSVIIDSGTDIHIVGNRELLVNYQPCSMQASPAGPGSLQIVGKGTMLVNLAQYVDTNCNVQPLDFELHDVYYAPECPYNLWSTALLRDDNVYLDTRSNCVIFPGMPDQLIGYSHAGVKQGRTPAGDPILSIETGVGKPVLRVNPVNRGCVWSDASSPTAVIDSFGRDFAANAVSFQDVFRGGRAYEPDAELVAHLSFHGSDWMLKRMQANPDLYGFLNLDVRGGVAKRSLGSRLARLPAGVSPGEQKPLRDAKHPGEVLHADLAGPVRPAGLNGFRYVLVVVCVFTRYTWAVPIRKKSEAAESISYIIERIRVHVVKAGEPGVRILHTDQGGEFNNNALRRYCLERGIIKQDTATAAHKSNGLVERRIRFLFDSVRAVLIPCGLNLRLWPECVMCVVHGQNLAPNSALYHDRRDDMVKAMAVQSRGVIDPSVLARVPAGIKKPAKRAREAQRMYMSEAKASAISEFEDFLAGNSDRDIIPYLSFWRDVSNERFQRLLKQQRPFGTPIMVYPRVDDPGKLEARGVPGFWVGAGAGPSMQRVFTNDVPRGRVRAVRQAVCTPTDLAKHLMKYD